ncbi:protein of unknown function (plasmid) [Pararobbsia alpina]
MPNDLHSFEIAMKRVQYYVPIGGAHDRGHFHSSRLTVDQPFAADLNCRRGDSEGATYLTATDRFEQVFDNRAPVACSLTTIPYRAGETV